MALDPKQPLGNSYFLTEADRTKFTELWKEHYRRYGQPKRVAEEQEYQAPEVYVARTPPEGIPAIIGSGPGFKRCSVYQSYGDEAEKQVEEVEGFVLDVYNISGSIIAGNTWVLLTRDKYGTWYAITGGGSSGFWAELVYKIPNSPPNYTEYYAVLVVDVRGDSVVSWEEVPDSEGDGDDPVNDLGLSGTGTGTGTGTDPSNNTYADILLCYEVNNVDIPYVPPFAFSSDTGSGSQVDPYPSGSPYGYQRQIVWLTPASVTAEGSGTGTADDVPYYLFRVDPRWEFIRPTSDPDSGGYQTAELLRYNQDTKQHEVFEQVFAFDVNGDYTDEVGT